MVDTFAKIPIILAVPEDMRKQRVNVVGSDFLAMSELEGLLYRRGKNSFPLHEAQVDIARAVRNHGSQSVLLGIRTPRPVCGARTTARFLFEHTEVASVLVVCTNPVISKPGKVRLTLYKMVPNQKSEKRLLTKEIPELHVWFHSLAAAREQLQQLRVAA